jgi:hypothetical protein
LQHDFKDGDLYYWFQYDEKKWIFPSNTNPPWSYDTITQAWIYKSALNINDFCERALYRPREKELVVQPSVSAIDSGGMYCTCAQPRLVQRYAGGWYNYCEICKKEKTK